MNVEGIPHNCPAVGVPKAVGGGAFDAPAVTDRNIFHLPANTQKLPTWLANILPQMRTKQIWQAVSEPECIERFADQILSFVGFFFG